MDGKEEDVAEESTSSAPRTRHASRMAFVSRIQVKALWYLPPEAKPWGPLRS